MASRQKLLSLEQKREIESVLGEAVNFLLGSRPLQFLSAADRVAWCGTHLLSYLGDCTPPPQPKEDPSRKAPTQETLRVVDDLRMAFKLAIVEAKAGDPCELPMRRVANALLQISIALEERAAGLASIANPTVGAQAAAGALANDSITSPPAQEETELSANEEWEEAVVAEDEWARGVEVFLSQRSQLPSTLQRSASILELEEMQAAIQEGLDTFLHGSVSIQTNAATRVQASYRGKLTRKLTRDLQLASGTVTQGETPAQTMLAKEDSPGTSSGYSSGGVKPTAVEESVQETVSTTAITASTPAEQPAAFGVALEGAAAARTDESRAEGVSDGAVHDGPSAG